MPLPPSVPVSLLALLYATWDHVIFVCPSGQTPSVASHHLDERIMILVKIVLPLSRQHNIDEPHFFASDLRATS